MDCREESRWIFGCGYLGRRVAERWRQQGHRVHVVTRSEEKAEGLRAAGFEAHVADIKQPLSLSALSQAERILWSVGFDRVGGESIKEVYVEGLRHLLDALDEADAPLQSLVYISSTGVYGEGIEPDAWVNEETPCHPVREGGVASLACEELLQSHSLGAKVSVLRLAGIYGPGRIPNAERLRRGEAIPGFSQGYLNLVHVDDAAMVVDAVLTLSEGELFVVSDGNPVAREEYYRFIAQCYGLDEVSLVEPPAGSAKSQRGTSSKRVDPSKLRERLRLDWEHEDYRSGVRQAIGET